MMISKYGKIKTTAELEKAIKAVHSEQKKLGKTVEKDFHGLREQYRPANLMAGALRQVAPYFTWSEIGLGLVRGVRRLLEPGTKHPKKEVPVSPEPPVSDQDQP
ncbi:MAG: hypothetical protein K5910_00710 [Bacteroidales bacterium]|nr:hypothetical protein [Bacteroidales bacterium]